MPLFIANRRVEFAQTDMAGVAHFSEYFRYLESAEHEFFRSVGLSVHLQQEDQQISFPRISCSFDFTKPLRFEDEFEVHLGVERLGEKSVTFRAEILSGGEIRARGRCTTVCCDMANGDMASIPIPENFRAALDGIRWES